MIIRLNDDLFHDILKGSIKEVAGSRTIVTLDKGTKSGRPIVMVSFVTEFGVAQTVMTLRQWITATVAFAARYEDVFTEMGIKVSNEKI